MKDSKRKTKFLEIDKIKLEISSKQSRKVLQTPIFTIPGKCRTNGNRWKKTGKRPKIKTAAGTASRHKDLMKSQIELPSVNRTVSGGI